MVNNEGHDHQTADQHVARTPTGTIGGSARIGDWSRGLVGGTEGERRTHMNSHRGQQPEPGSPQESWFGLQKVGVGVDQLRVTEHLEVAHQMTDDKTEERQAGQGHQVLLPQGGSPNALKQVHWSKVTAETRGFSNSTPPDNSLTSNRSNVPGRYKVRLQPS
jgi:hypothetical protein